MNYQRILIAVDSSESSMQAARRGLDLAHQLNAQAALVFVVDTTKSMGNIDAGITHEDALIVLKKEAEQALDQLASMYNGQGLLKFMPEGHPVDEVIGTAISWKADLIVMGTHGRTGLSHLLMGSVAEQVLRRATVPVLVIKQEKAD